MTQVEPVRSRRLAWWGAAAGVLIALVDTTVLGWLGTEFRLSGRDVSWLVATWFGGTLGLTGFLLGDAIEARRGERAAAKALAAARLRVAQSEKLAVLGQLAAAIAHEVRNPLAVVRSSAQGLTETLPADDVEGRRAATFIITEIDRLSNVVSTLLAFARPLRVEARAVSIEGVIDRALALAAETLAQKHVRLVNRADRALPSVRADADLVCQALLDLLTNAAEAAPGGEVSIGAVANAETVEVTVSDNGPGIPAAMRAQIFEPFFTTRTDGTGLGLAVARQVIEAQGGRIEVSDGPGGGARFTVVLPREQAAMRRREAA
jgi:two-component system sensor histidine kinase HydH